MAKGGKRKQADGRLRVIAGGAPKIVLPGPGPKRPSSSAPAATAQPKSGPPNKRRESPPPGEVEENASAEEESSSPPPRQFPRWGIYAIGAVIAVIAAYFVLRRPPVNTTTLLPSTGPASATSSASASASASVSAPGSASASAPP